MNLTNQIVSTREQFKDFITNYPDDTPVVMVNILKFKRITEGGLSGRERYKRYSINVAPLIKKAGAKILWAGNVRKTVIGDSNSEPDMILIVKYPNKQAFVNMATSPDYQLVKDDRELAIEYGGLLASESIAFGQ